ncbi:3762_t:CDS:1, partial [Funneliformis caledonium]
LKSYSFAEQITMLTKVLYKQRGNLELNPTHFKQMIEAADLRLQGLFDKLVKALVPDNRSAYNKVEARKTIVSLCYIMAGMRNKFVNNFKLEVGLFLSASGSTRNTIDTMNSIRFSAYYTTVNNFKRKLVNEHPLNIRKFLLEN